MILTDVSIFPSLSEVNKNLFFSGVCPRQGQGCCRLAMPSRLPLPSAYRQEPCQLGWPGNALLPHRSVTTGPCQDGSRGLVTSLPHQHPCGILGTGPRAG